MIFVIDGHNLIGKLPDIELSDPDDEQKLVTRLNDWCTLDKRRKIMVFFDAGEFGGLGNMLSRPTVRVQFSRVGQTADAVIVKYLESIKNPQEFTLVTSDREIIYAARKRRVGYILSEEFSVLLAEELGPYKPADDDNDSADSDEKGAEADVEVSDDEVQTWLKAFEKAPHRAPDVHIVQLPPRDVRKNPNPSNDLDHARQQSLIRKKKLKAIDPDKLKEGETELSQADMDEWIALFGDETVRQKKESEKPVVIPNPAAARKKPTRRKTGEPVVRKFAEDQLTGEEVDTWLEIFDKRKK
ncbi:MAG: NYN domain-containing protein [Anaerolineae bacterium]